MRRRKWWILGITFLVLMTTFGAYYQSTIPRFKFLRGMSPAWIEASGAGTTADYSETYYVSTEIEEIKKAAVTELEAKQWEKAITRSANTRSESWFDPTSPAMISFSGGERVVAVLKSFSTKRKPVPQGTLGVITLSREPSIFDRAHAWIWDRMHP